MVHPVSQHYWGVQMPKIGMEPFRRESLVTSAIAAIGEAGSLDVTMSQIAKRAGVSSALAHHYFGTKDQILLSAMRHILKIYGAEVVSWLKRARTPRERVEAILRASFAESNFRPEVISAWLNFYVKAQSSESSARLLAIYRRRLRSNLLHGLRPLLDGRSESAAEGLAAMIDGLYIRQSLDRENPDAGRAVDLVIGYLDRLLEAPQ